MTVTNLDGEVFIRARVPTLPRKTFVYCDPPHFHQSHRLYLNYYKPEDHLGTRRNNSGSNCTNWLCSYDNVPNIATLCARRCVHCRCNTTRDERVPARNFSSFAIASKRPWTLWVCG